MLGHANFISLGRREALSIFGETYTFIQRHYHIPHRLWRSVRRELEIWIGVSPLIWRDLALPWSSEVISVDASTWGLGATTTSDFTIPEIQQLGRFSERWRFDIDEFKYPRASAFGVHSNAVTDEADVLQWAASNSEARGLVGQKPIQVVEQKPQSEVFQQTPFSSVQKRWRVCGRFAWKRKEPMPVLEGRASLFGVKHKLRSVDGFHKRHLFLTDSITAACSLDKGRGSSFKMRRVTQQIGALWLASGSSGHYRWLPSEWNPADGPSRGSRYPSVPVQYPADGHLPPAASVSPTECKALQKGAERSCNGAEGQEGEAPTAIAGSGIFSCSLGGGTVPEQISGMLQQVLPYDQPSEEQDQVLPNLGQCLDICADRNVWGRGRHQSGQLHDSGGSLFSARVQDTKDDRSPQHQAEPSRMAQTGSSQVPFAFTLASGLFDGEGGFQTKADTTRADDAVGVQCLPASWRDRKAAGTRFGASCDQAEILEPGSSSLRRGDPFQDRGVRRDVDAGPISHPAPDNLQGDESAAAASLSPSVHQDSQGVEGFHDKPQRSLEAGEAGRASPIPPPTWRGQRGLQQTDPHPARNSEEGEVEVLQQCAEVRKGRPGQPASQQPTGSHFASRKQRRSRDPNNSPKPALEPAASLFIPVFLEFFSGSGHLANSVATNTGWPTLLWDITLGEQYDLRSAAKRRLIVDWVRSNRICGLHLGTPCESFTRARDVPPGSPPLRSDAKPLGLEDLKPHDQLKVQIGNLFMRFSVTVLLWCGLLGIPATLENPARSRIWLCPPIVALLRRNFCRQFETHYCFWGKLFKKATIFLAIHVNLSRLEFSQCKCSKRGICGFTGKPHQQLVGRNAAGQWRTKLAEPYPSKMCEAIAKDFRDFEVQQIASHFSRHTSLSA